MARPTMPVDRSILHGELLIDASIRSPKLGSSAVGGTAIASSAVSTAKIASAAIVSPKLGTSSVGPTAIATGAVIGPKLGASAVGLTAAATAVQRSLTVVSLGSTPASAYNALVFRSPPSGATITAVYLAPGAAYNASAGITGTNWIFSLKNKKTGGQLNKNACSLSNQTLAATAFKTIPVNNNNSTVLSGHMLRLECTITGAPVPMNYPICVIEWVPKNNA